MITTCKIISLSSLKEKVKFNTCDVPVHCMNFHLLFLHLIWYFLLLIIFLYMIFLIYSWHIHICSYIRITLGLIKMSTVFSDVRFAKAGFSKYHSGDRLFRLYCITVAYSYTLIVSWLLWREAGIKIVNMCRDATLISHFSDRGVRILHALTLSAVGYAYRIKTYQCNRKTCPLCHV